MNEKKPTIHNAPLSLRDMPSVRQLRAFVAVCQSGHISAAAEMLSVTQPAVTVLLRELEDRLRVKLFDRTTRSLRRTNATEEAYEYARRVLAEIDSMRHAMSQIADSQRGTLRIAATATVVQTILPDVLRQFSERHPSVKVLIDDCAPGDFVERIMSERVDCGVGTLEAPVPGLEERIFLSDPVVAAAPSSLFGTAQPIRWTELDRFATITVRAGYGIRRRIEQAALQAGLDLRITREVALFPTAVALAAGGQGVAIVPESVVSASPHQGLGGRRLVEPTLEKATAFISKKDRSLPPSAQSLNSLLQERFG
jgi:LysR family carnitine catabolism transcriptional activator